MRKKNSKNSKMKNTHSSNNDMRQRKYFNIKKEALKACEERNKPYGNGTEVFKMPKGSRHSGQYAVCDYIEYLNTY